MRNVWIICRKELGSYFASPVAYILLIMFGVIFGFFFWNALGAFVFESIQSQMSGRSFPMNLNEWIIRPLLSNASVIGLFFIPMITMRLFAEEKRTGTIELLATSPVRDMEIILGKWLASIMLYACLLLFTAINFAFLFKYGHPDWKPLLVGYLGLLLQAGALLAIGTFHLHTYQESNYCRRRDIRRVPAAVGAGMGERVRDRDLGPSIGLHVSHHALRVLCQGRA